MPDAGCIQSGVTSMEFVGQDRPYAVHVPRAWDGAGRLPVVYLFHGLGGQADVMMAYTGLAQVADERGFAIIAPQAVGPRSSWDYRSTGGSSDLAFVEALAETIGALDCIDEDRQFATGFSNGSAFVFAMACAGDLPFRSHAGVAAAFYDVSCVDAPPAPIVYLHGTADDVVPFMGGPTPIEPVEPVESTMAAWARHGGCDAVPEVSMLGEDVEHVVWQACEADLEAYYVRDGGHVWPGAAALPFGRTTSTIRASTILADFFGLRP